jgi:hypothetical protein
VILKTETFEPTLAVKDVSGAPRDTPLPGSSVGRSTKDHTRRGVEKRTVTLTLSTVIRVRLPRDQIESGRHRHSQYDPSAFWKSIWRERLPAGHTTSIVSGVSVKVRAVGAPSRSKARMRRIEVADSRGVKPLAVVEKTPYRPSELSSSWKK